MNLVLPMNTKKFNDMQEEIASTFNNVADASMKNAPYQVIDKQGGGDCIKDKVILLFPMMEAYRNVVVTHR